MSVFASCRLVTCVCVCHPRYAREEGREGEGGREKHLPLVADQVVGRSSSHAPTGYTNSVIHTFIHSFILSALIRQAEFTGIRSGSEDQDVLRALFEYFSSTIRGENLKDIRPENSHVHFAYITIALPYPISLPFSLSQFCSWVPTSFFAAFLVGFLVFFFFNSDKPQVTEGFDEVSHLQNELPTWASSRACNNIIISRSSGSSSIRSPSPSLSLLYSQASVGVSFLCNFHGIFNT